MEFDKSNFDPTDQGEILDLGTLLKSDDKPEETLPINLVEETSAAEEEPVKVETVKETSPETVKTEVPTSNYKAYVQKKIEAGEWYPVDELEEIDVDEAIFDEIVTQQIKKAEEDAKENTVKTDTLSPMMLKALEIDKNGGNISQVFETYKNIYENPENPIGNLDLSNPAHQESLLKYYHKSRGLEDFEVQSIVEGHKKNLTLDKASEKAKVDIDTLFNNYLEQQAATTEETKKQRQEALKAYRANTSEAAKKYQINENYRKTIVDKISKPDEKGTYAVDAMYDAWRRDPEKAVQIMMFMDNPEEYIKIRASKVINQEKEKIFNSIKLTNKGKATGGAPEYNSSTKNQDKDVLSLSEL